MTIMEKYSISFLVEYSTVIAKIVINVVMFLTATIGFFAVSYGKVIFFQNISLSIQG